MKLNKTIKIIFELICLLSVIIMIYLVFTPHFPLHMKVQNVSTPTYITVGRASVAYIPFQEIYSIGFLLNIFMTMPLGGLFLLLTNGTIKFRRILCYGVFVGMLIESIQFILDNIFSNFHRFVDINDVISNMIGIIVGFYLLLFLIKIINKYLK